jgi:hypothetical protein
MSWKNDADVRQMDATLMKAAKAAAAVGDYEGTADALMARSRGMKQSDLNEVIRDVKAGRR